MADYLPAAEGPFDVFANDFVNVIKTDPTRFEVKPETVTELEGLVAEWDATYAEVQAKRDVAQAATTLKD